MTTLRLRWSQRLSGIKFGRAARGDQSGQRGQQDDRQRREHHARIHREGQLSPSREAVGRAGSQQHAEQSTDQTHGQTLGPDLLQDVIRRGSQRAADADFAASLAQRLTAHEHDDERRDHAADDRDAQQQIEHVARDAAILH